MTIRRIIAVDPGKTTGLVDWDATGSDSVATFDAHEFNFRDTCRFLLALASDQHAADTLIVCERFIITPATAKNSQAPWSLELIGVARMVSELYLGRELAMEQVAAAKRFSTDQRLKYMGWHTPGKGHANDAARHLMLALAKRGMLGDKVLSVFADMP